MEYPSKLIEDAVESFVRFPGIGKKTALRLVLHLLKQDKEKIGRFSDVISRLGKEIQYCSVCHNITEGALCAVCSDPKRDHSTICIVEDIRDLLAIENTDQYHGGFHVLGGLISPMEGVGPEQLNIASLVQRVRQGEVNELIYALSSTMEGDTTMFYISRQLKGENIRISSIARGISIGGELEYTDEITLARSISQRVPYTHQ